MILTLICDVKQVQKKKKRYLTQIKKKHPYMMLNAWEKIIIFMYITHLIKF